MRKIITILLLLVSFNSYGHGHFGYPGGVNVYNFNYGYNNAWLYTAPILGMTSMMLMQNMMQNRQQPIIIQQPPPVYNNPYNMNNCYYGNVMENGIYVNRLICR